MRSFRFDPPEPRQKQLTRPRLLGPLLARWDHRVTLLVGGPGLGKTTLLAQAVRENRLAPRGDDVWVGVEPHDADGAGLALAVWAALAADDDPANPVDPADLADRAGAGRGNGRGNGSRHGGPSGPGGLAGSEDRGEAPTPTRVAEAVWQRSPQQVCVVLDDVHRLPPGSAGADWLARFVTALPANGHVVLSSRGDPPIPLARLEGIGVVQRIGEDDLRLDGDELAALAERHGVPVDRLAPSGGWPAMADLAGSAEGDRVAGDFLWEEVLEPLGEARRRILAVVCDLGGADDRLASTALGTSVDLRTALAGVPLIAVGADGWHLPHALWSTAPRLALTGDDRAEVRRRAVRDLTARGRIDQAYGLVVDAELWDEAPAVLRAACLESERCNPRRLDRCLNASPAAVRATPAGQLAGALKLAFTRPAAAIEPLRRAVEACRAAGDVEAELTALAQLGRLAWGRQDRATIGGEVAARIAEIEATGNRTARSLAGFIRALAADLAGDDGRVLAELDAIDRDGLDPVWDSMATWLRGGVLLDQGHADAALELLDAHEHTGDPAVVSILDGLRIRCLWALGRVDEAFARLPGALAALRTAGIAALHAQGLVNAAMADAHVGDVAQARRHLDEAAAASAEPVGAQTARTAIAETMLLLAAGDVEGAAELLGRVYDEQGGWEHHPDRRTWRHMLAVSYVLVPQSRASWDAAPLLGHMAVARELAAALVAARAGQGTERLWQLDLGDLAQVRGALHHRLAAELAVHLHAIGRPEGALLLESLGPRGRALLQEVAGRKDRAGKQARSLLAAVPAPPPVVSRLGVLGPLQLWRDGDATGGPHEVLEPDLRRPKVRSLLGYLVTHRRTHRAAIGAALWPDLDDRAAANNLGVTLSYLLHALEPWRSAGEAPYLVRLDGPTVELVPGDHLVLDVDELDRHLALAEQAEADGTPSLALTHHLAACELYRGDLLDDVPDADWIDLDRTRYRSRFVAAAIRAAQLLVGRGDLDRAEAHAQRAITADPWSEEAYGVLATAALDRGDRTAAREAVTRCLAALADLGAEPTEPTLHLARRCGLGLTVPLPDPSPDARPGAAARRPGRQPGTERAVSPGRP
ncbi:MAG TPA: BTAD domain-containing putative transcriptional regulator [Acidimicrobiales bacterium]